MPWLLQHARIRRLSACGRSHFRRLSVCSRHDNPILSLVLSVDNLIFSKYKEQKATHGLVVSAKDETILKSVAACLLLLLLWILLLLVRVAGFLMYVLE
jgi:hypothetical protein